MSVTPGAAAIVVALFLWCSVECALELESFIAPPVLIFFTIYHGHLVAFILLGICAVDLLVKRTPSRVVVLLIAILVAFMLASESTREAPRQNDGGYSRRTE